MPRATTGFGANHGYNFGGGGLIYVSNLTPPENTLIPLGGVTFTVGVKGALIDITTVQITVNAVLAFDGSIPGFVGTFSGPSSFSFSPNDNGYTFNFQNGTPYTTTQVTFDIIANTLDGGSTNQSFVVLASPSANYPPMPFTKPLAQVQLSQFTGELQTGLLQGGHGQIFFSPALLEANTGTQIDINEIDILVHAGDQTKLANTYAAHPGQTVRPAVWGPPPLVPPPPGSNQFPPPYSHANYFPEWGPNLTGGDPGPLFTIARTTKAEVTGTLFDTISSTLR